MLKRATELAEGRTNPFQGRLLRTHTNHPLAMRPTQLLPAFLALAVLTACNEERRQTAAREVSEEVAPLVEAVGPESAETPLPPPPPALISIDETLAAIPTSGGLISLGATAATPVIDKWIGTLAGNRHVDDSDLLVEDLKRLRVELAKPSPDADQLEDILERLARETRQAGKDAEDERVGKLAEWLEAAAEAVD